MPWFWVGLRILLPSLMPRWIKGKLSAPTRESPWNPFTVYHQRTLTQTQRPRPMAEYWYDEAYHGLGLAIRFLTVFLILLVSWFYPVLQMCQVYRDVPILVNSIYIHTIVLLFPGFVWFCLFFDKQFSRCFYLKSDGFIPSVVGVFF